MRRPLLAIAAAMLVFMAGIAATRADRSLVPNSQLEPASTKALAPEGFELTGDVAYGPFGDARREISGRGVRLLAGKDENKDGQHAGSVAFGVANLTPESGRWFRFRIRGLCQDDFAVKQDGLYLRVDFFRDKGTNSLDHIRKAIDSQVERDRKDLRDAGTNRNLGTASWRSYELDFRTPFPEVDKLVLTAGFEHGSGRGEFWISEFELTPIDTPAEFAPHPKALTKPSPLAGLVPLGGRWYYDPQGGSLRVPDRFDHTNSDRLCYLSDRVETPFADNMTAWLRTGWYDRSGKLTQEDQFVPENVVITVTDNHLVVRSQNLPNHPTAVFPDRSRLLDGNPNSIQQKDYTWVLPLEPQVNPQHVAMNERNANQALPMGPIGIATNGIVFFNPFDQGAEDAVWRLDRCCGHPTPDATYHYHKYPVCVKSPWSDDGEDHSPVIGFAFDGFPVYGPYEAKGELAKDSKSNPLNEFNVHFDEERGWHYHVTPGKFPHIIGGYWGIAEARNRRAPPRMGPVRGPGL